ncbi:transcriptional regulator domain-containing protein [Sphingobium sp. EM0848]|uniref:transcriptional regulator domain-containing protein n=1 Tax=Sphingobium sp. EM0848 TaxID=2743473 RepID=UPI00159C2190
MTRGSIDPAPENWRDPGPYAALHGIDRAGLMWEWLRRDQDYVAWYAQASRMTRGTADPAHWGLHFR